MKRLTPTPQYYAALAVTIFAASWIFSSVVTMLLRPNVDSNAYAYIVLIDAINQSNYSQMEGQARQAQSMTSDPDIRKISDFVARAANLNMRSGSQTVEEANSFSGFGKAFVVGFINPLMGVEGGMIFIEGMFTNFETIGNRLDDRYQPVFRRYQFAESTGTVIFWLILIGGFAGYFYFREKLEKSLLPFLKPYRFFQIGIHEQPQ